MRALYLRIRGQDSPVAESAAKEHEWPAAGEVIGLLVLAVKQQIPVPDLRDLIYPYPTFVRGIEDALSQLEG